MRNKKGLRFLKHKLIEFLLSGEDCELGLTDKIIVPCYY